MRNSMGIKDIGHNTNTPDRKAVERTTLHSDKVGDNTEVRLYRWNDNGALLYSVVEHDLEADQDYEEQFHGFDYPEACRDYKFRVSQNKA